MSAVGFKTFESSFSSWDTLFKQAVAFIATLDKTQLITLTTSEDRSRGNVTVWYWLKAER